MSARDAGARDDDEPLGLVYRCDRARGGDRPTRAARALAPLRNLGGGWRDGRGLGGRFVEVRNATVVNQPGPGGEPRPMALGPARPGADGTLRFEPGHGGGRLDKLPLADEGLRRRYVEASRFGEVNTYYHLDRAGAYVDDLLDELGAPSLPRVVAVVNAHAATVDDPAGGARDGRRCPDGRYVPFQGGHYRLPGAASARLPERAPLSPDGEIHLGPGQKLSRAGALARLAGGAYRANASHNPAIIYHEYGHHLCRHTADFRANRRRAPGQQSNRKTALDEGTADYFAASLLETPHIWFFHHRDEPAAPHRRSLTSPRAMDSYLRGPAGDAHANGTIWAAALWELRLAAERRAGQRDRPSAVDRLLLQALLLIGGDGDGDGDAGGERDATRALLRARASFRRAGLALLEADALLYGGALRDDIARVLGGRGIHPEGSREPAPRAPGHGAPSA